MVSTWKRTLVLGGDDATDDTRDLSCSSQSDINRDVARGYDAMLSYVNVNECYVGLGRDDATDDTRDISCSSKSDNKRDIARGYDATLRRTIRESYHVIMFVSQ